MIIDPSVESFLAYAKANLFLDEYDALFARNLILEELKITSYEEYEVDASAENQPNPDALLKPLLDYAVESGVIGAGDRNYMAAKLMSLVALRPSAENNLFEEWKAENPAKAEKWIADYKLHRGNYDFVAEVKKKWGEAETPISRDVARLLCYASLQLLATDEDMPLFAAYVCDALKIPYVCADYDAPEEIEPLTVPDTVMQPLLAYAVESGVISEDESDWLDAKLLGLLSMLPSELDDTVLTAVGRSASKAFDFLYDYCIKNDYVRSTRIAKNRHWEAKGTAGKLEITINLSKPEKSNKETAKMLTAKTKKYPACHICPDNLGYGHGDAGPKQNLRYVPMTMGGEPWYWQFSPYSYFNQHGIAFNEAHTPMKVDKTTLTKLFDFIDAAPQSYFIGCNAALPRVGGSILTHDHFQGGGKSLPMHKAGNKLRLRSMKHPYVDLYIIDWYNSALRLVSSSRNQLIEFGGEIIEYWNGYSDESVGIIARDTEQHNALVPIVRRHDGKYILELILRNNRVDATYPDGIFHAHPEYHNIKSEAIGLIEAMGLFILPGRLDRQLDEIEKYLTKEVRYNADRLAPDMAIHKDMIERLLKEQGNKSVSVLEAKLNIRDEINRVCEQILINTAVFKPDEQGQAAFMKFLEGAGIGVYNV